MIVVPDTLIQSRSRTGYWLLSLKEHLKREVALHIKDTPACAAWVSPDYTRWYMSLYASTATENLDT